MVPFYGGWSGWPALESSALPGRRHAHLGRQLVPLHREQVEPGKGGGGRECTARLLQPADEAAACLGRVGLCGGATQLLQPGAEHRVVDVQRQREDLFGALAGDAEHGVVVLGRVETHRVVQDRAVVVTHVHRRVDREQEEADPQRVAALQQRRVGAHDQREGFAMAEFVVAPAFEPAEDRVETFVRMALQLAVDRDVAGVADLLGQVGRVEDVLGLEVGVGLGAFEAAEVHAQAVVLQGRVQEARVPRFVARHETHQRLDVRVADVLLDLVVEHAARELRRERADQELEEFLAQFGRPGRRQFGHFIGELFVALKVVVVVVAFVLGQHRIPLGAHRAHVDAVHRRVVGLVEARAQQVADLGVAGRVLRGLDGGAWGHGVDLVLPS